MNPRGSLVTAGCRELSRARETGAKTGTITVCGTWSGDARDQGYSGRCRGSPAGPVSGSSSMISILPSASSRSLTTVYPLT